MSSSPIVSVVMSVYNAERYVAEAVESILAQTFTDFEFILFDDGSTDGSLPILQKLAAKDSRIRLTSRPNKGLTVTLNEALAQARGEFIARMDCDDIALPNRLELQVAAMRKDADLACVGGQFELMDAKGRTLTVLWSPTENDAVQQECLKGHNPICHPTAMFRRAAAERVGGYDPYFKTTQDLDLWLRLGEVGKLGNVPEVVLRFRLHESSVSETKREQQKRNAEEACRRAWQRRGITGTFEAVEHWRPGKDRRSRQQFALRYGWWAFNSRQKRTALVYGAKALAALPWGGAGWKLLACAALKSPKAEASRPMAAARAAVS